MESMALLQNLAKAFFMETTFLFPNQYLRIHKMVNSRSMHPNQLSVHSQRWSHTEIILGFSIALPGSLHILR